MARIIETVEHCDDTQPSCKTAPEMEQICCKSAGAVQCCEKTEKGWGGYSKEEILDRLGIVLDERGLDAQGRPVIIEFEPRENPCGDKVTSYDFIQRGCCEDVIPMEASSSNPTSIDPGAGVGICVADGLGPYTWRASVGYTLASKTTVEPCNTITALAWTCGDALVRVIDLCGGEVNIDLSFTGTTSNPVADNPDVVMAPNSETILSVSNAVLPLSWKSSSSDLTLGTPSGKQVPLYSGPEFCDAGIVTATDACGQSVSMTIKSTDGYWSRMYVESLCEIEGGIIDEVENGDFSCSMGQGLLVDIYTDQGKKYSVFQQGSWDPSGPCNGNPSKPSNLTCPIGTWMTVKSPYAYAAESDRCLGYSPHCTPHLDPPVDMADMPGNWPRYLSQYIYEAFEWKC